MVMELIVYFFLITLFLIYIGLWNIQHFKDSILWLILSGFILYKDVIINKNWQDTMKNYILKVVSFSAIGEFLVNIICLPIWILLLLFPIIFLFQIISAYSEDKEEYKIAHNCAENIIATVGFGILIYIGYQLVINFRIILQIENLKAFILPIIYTCAFLPFCLVNKIFSEYKQAYLRLSWRNDIKIPVNLKYIWGIYQFCKLDFEKLNKFLYFLTSSSYLNKTTEIDDLISEYKKQTTFLKFDSSCIGFKIDEILNLFSVRNMQIEDYRYLEYDEGYGNYYGDKYLKLNTCSFNGIVYSVEGTNQIIQKVKILYTKNSLTSREFSQESNHIYLELCQSLYFYCFQCQLSQIDLISREFKDSKEDFNISNEIKIYNKQITEYNFIISVKNPIHSEYYNK